MSTKRVGAELLQPTCDVRKPLDFPWSAPSCSRAKPASCDSFSRTFDLPVLLPTAFIQNHHKFKLSVVKQPELPSQRSPLGYRPEGIPGQHRFSFPASRSAALPRHLTAPPARPGLPAGPSWSKGIRGDTRQPSASIKPRLLGPVQNLLCPSRTPFYLIALSLLQLFYTGEAEQPHRLLAGLPEGARTSTSLCPTSTPMGSFSPPNTELLPMPKLLH